MSGNYRWSGRRYPENSGRIWSRSDRDGRVWSFALARALDGGRDPKNPADDTSRGFPLSLRRRATPGREGTASRDLPSPPSALLLEQGGIHGNPRHQGWQEQGPPADERGRPFRRPPVIRQRPTETLSSTIVTPGAAQAARSARSRSNQARTFPSRRTFPPSIVTRILDASSSA